MAATILTSVQEYLATSFRPDREYADGAVLERHVGERDHSRAQMRLSAYLFNRAAEWGIHVFPEQRVQVKPTRFRVPDIAVVAGDEPCAQQCQRDVPRGALPCPSARTQVCLHAVDLVSPAYEGVCTLHHQVDAPAHRQRHLGDDVAERQAFQILELYTIYRLK